MACDVLVCFVPIENIFLCAFVRYHVVWGIMMFAAALATTCICLYVGPDCIDLASLLVVWIQILGMEIGLPVFCLHLYYKNYIKSRPRTLNPVATVIGSVSEGVVDERQRNSGVEQATAVPTGCELFSRKSSI